MFPQTIHASVIRIVPMTWHGAVGLRWEILGCDSGKILLMFNNGMFSLRLIDSAMFGATFNLDTRLGLT